MTNIAVVEEEDALTDHDYDGIQEFDNPLPGWWKWLFVVTIVFSGFYWLYYEIGVGPSVEDNYESEKVAYVRRMVEQLGEIHPDDNTIMSFAQKQEWMSAMAGVFVGNCAQCHANDGGGNIGPNLTDDNYKNITRPQDIFNVITNGVPGTAMVARGNQMSPEEIILLSAYVASLRGTTPAKPKAAEGAPIEPWPAMTAEAETAPAPGEDQAAEKKSM